MAGKLILRVAWFSALALCVSGCAAVAPLTSVLTGGAPTRGLEVHSETSVKLQEGNFVTVRTNVVGSSKGFNLLGFITLYPATINKAMNRLYAAAEAEQGRPQTLAHLIVEHSGIYVILFSIPEVTVRADLIEFVPASEPEEEESPDQQNRILRTSHRQPPTRSRNRWQ